MAQPVITDIILAHHFSSPPGWYSDEYLLARRFHGVVYVLEGYAEYVLGDGTRLHARPGDCFYVPKGSVYTTRCNASQPFIHLTVNFDLLGSDRLFPGVVKQKIRSALRFEQQFFTLVHCWTARHPYYRERCMGMLYELLYLLLREARSPAQPYKEKLRPARQYLDEHFNEDFPLNLLPQLCGLSETYFRRLFHRVFHETPAQYRQRLRIACAEDLLLTGHYSVTETAQQCGYPDPAYFSRMFRKTTGMSPSQYVASACGPETPETERR